jgi:putative membrane protein
VSGPGGLPVRWQRLHPLSIMVRLGRSALPIVVVLLLGGLGSSQGRQAVVFRLVLVAGVGLLGVVSWLVTRWRVADGALQIETGLLRRRSLRYPLTQLQAVDVVRPGVARVLGMAELRLRMASGSATTGRLAYLRCVQAEVLRAQLLALAHGLDAAEPPPPETVVCRVATGTLLASLLISGTAVSLVIAVAGFAVLAVATPSLAGAGAAGGTALTLFLGVGGALWQRFNAAYHLTVAEAPDGLRVHSGLVERSAETIPDGRVQALRLVQPLTWRPFGWCRVEVDVAGRVTTSRRSRSQRRSGRALLPVGTLAEARCILNRVLPDAPDGGMAPPPRARWKTPLRYGNLSFGAGATVAVVTGGRLRLVTDWVPLAKLQSVRRTEGPLQRRLRLANVHLDTAGRAVFAVARDRDAAEADALVDWLAGAARHARSRQRGVGSGRAGGSGRGGGSGGPPTGRPPA